MTATLEALACIAFKQPIYQTEIDRLFATDKRRLVVKLRNLGLVEEFAGDDGRLRFTTMLFASLRAGKFAGIDRSLALRQSTTRHRTVDIKLSVGLQWSALRKRP
jgi:hypothetical protein